jgi:hypothetical protein
MAKVGMAALVFFVIFLTSCKTTTTRFIFDESIPLEESVIIENGTSERFTVTHVNGIPVNWQKTGKGKSKIEMQIPADNIELTMRIHIDSGNAYYTIIYNDPNAKIHYNFIVGNDYIIDFWPDYDRETRKFAKDQFFKITNQTTNDWEKVIIEKRMWELFLQNLR